MTETQESITKWADETFGEAKEWESCVRRSVEEMREFIAILDDPELDLQEFLGNRNVVEELANESADVVITLYRLASVLGRLLHDEIDRKMGVNRERKWRRDGTGHGYHVKEEG